MYESQQQVVDIRAGSCPPVALELMERAWDTMAAARSATDMRERYIHAHIGALRAAAAVLAAAGVSRGPRGRLMNVWQEVAKSLPEFSSWARNFTVSARTRGAIDSGRVTYVSVEQANAMVKEADGFVAAVCDHLGLGWRCEAYEHSA